MIPFPWLGRLMDSLPCIIFEFNKIFVRFSTLWNTTATCSKMSAGKIAQKEL